MPPLVPLFVLTFLSLSVAAQTLPSDGWLPLTYDTEQAPADNPLKGFMPFSGEYDSFPHSMEFDYVGFATLMSGPDTFTFDTGLEPLLNEIAGRGHQAVIRVYLDYPDTDTSIPQFLLDAGLQTTPYSGSSGAGLSPDYENESLVTALESFIAAFGVRYDGDPRLGFVEIGLLGHWGEWHTFPEEDLFPGVSTQNRILTAFDNAFNRTRILVSQDILGHNPMAGIVGKNIGFHDDDFSNASLPTTEDHFWSRMETNGLDSLWQTQPNAGEVQPDFQEVLFDVPSGAPEDFATAVTTTHMAWLLYHQAFEGENGGSNGWDDAKIARAAAGARLTGYEFFVSEANLPDTTTNASFALGVHIENRGLTPFYYDWPFKITVTRTGQTDVILTPQSWNLSTIPADGSTKEFLFELDNHGLEVGSYQIYLSVPNVMHGGKSIGFANTSQGEKGVLLGSLAVTGGGESEMPGGCALAKTGGVISLKAVDGMLALISQLASLHAGNISCNTMAQDTCTQCERVRRRGRQIK